jgi:hypothetical protein
MITIFADVYFHNIKLLVQSDWVIRTLCETSSHFKRREQIFRHLRLL